VALGRLGISFFHPGAASSVNRAAAGPGRGAEATGAEEGARGAFGLSVFLAVGILGMALSQPYFSLFTAWLGNASSALLAIPAVALAMVYLFSRGLEEEPATPALSLAQAGRIFLRRLGVLLLLLLIMILRYSYITAVGFFAAKLFADTEDMAEVAHVAKIAERRVKLAETVAEAGKAREEEKMLLESRQKIQMEMREREIAALKARPTDTGMVLTLGGDVLFTTGSSAVSRGAQAQLNRIAQFLIENPDREVVVTGHTDSTGSAATNERLSEERAAAVGSYLATRGVDPSRIATRGMGPSMPIAPNDTASGRQQNRRVDIEILNPGQLASEQVLTR